MEAIRDIADLDHLGHVESMPHVRRMFKGRFALPAHPISGTTNSPGVEPEEGFFQLAVHMINCGPQKIGWKGSKVAKRNLTVELDDEVIKKAKVVAAKRGTSVSRLVAMQLEDLVEEDVRYEEARERAQKALANAKPRGGRTWRREDLYER